MLGILRYFIFYISSYIAKSHSSLNAFTEFHGVPPGFDTVLDPILDPILDLVLDTMFESVLDPILDPIFDSILDTLLDSVYGLLNYYLFSF
jgi:hypothetical protein